jgi:drug/metabolite transporter (DMT)-like permease
MESPEGPRALAGVERRAVRRRAAYLADLGLLAITVVWGSTFIIIKDALAGVGALEFIALRFGVALAVLALFFHRRLGRLGPDGWRAGVLIGLFLFAGYALQTVGLLFTSASTAAFITGLSVLIVPIIDFAVLGQRVRRGVIIGVLLAPLGLWLLTTGQRLSFGPGEVLLLACAGAFATHIVAISVFARRYDPLGLAIVQVAVVAALAGLAAAAFEKPFPILPGPSVWGAVLYTGAVATAFVLAVQTTIQRFTTATHAALIFSLEPVFAAIFAYLLAHETLGPTAILGAAIMLAAMLLAEVGR